MKKNYKLIFWLILVVIVVTLGLWKNSQYQTHNGNIIKAFSCVITGGEYRTEFKSSSMCGGSMFGCIQGWQVSEYTCQK